MHYGKWLIQIQPWSEKIVGMFLFSARMSSQSLQEGGCFLSRSPMVPPSVFLPTLHVTAQRVLPVCFHTAVICLLEVSCTKVKSDPLLRMTYERTGFSTYTQVLTMHYMQLWAIDCLCVLRFYPFALAVLTLLSTNCVFWSFFICASQQRNDNNNSTHLWM